MSTVLIIIYIVLMLANLYKSLKLKEDPIPELLALFLLAILMCGHFYVGNGDSTDLFYYERDYANVLTRYNIQDYSLYYLFWGTQVIGNLIGLSYHSWWMVMTILSLILIHRTFKENQCNRNYCMFFFMFYAIALFAGLKYYYGFCILSFGMKYLLRGKKRDKLRFALFILAASGFHAMYYLLFILLLIDIPLLTPKIIFRITSLLFIGVLILGRSSFVSTISNVVVPMLTASGNTRFVYFQDKTSGGVIIPIVLHLVTLLYAYKYNDIIKYEGLDELIVNSERLLRANFIMVLLYPLYLFAITFARLNTVVSLITIFYSSINYSSISYGMRKRLLLYGLLVLLFFGLYFYGACGYYEYNLKPMFDVNAFVF